MALTAGCVSGPVRPDVKNLMWPPPPDNPRIRYLAEYKSQADLKKDSMKARLLGDSGGGLMLEKPYGVAATPDGKRIYVTDTKLRALMVFDLEQGRLIPFRTDARGGLVSPIEVRLDSRGRIYVTDSVHARVNVYEPDGTTVLSLGREQELERPTGLAVDETLGRIYVCDTARHRVLVFDMQGQLLQEIGERGSAPGQFNFPVNLATDREGNLYVVDTGNFRIQIFGTNGEFKHTFGQAGDGFGAMARPKGVALDSDGNVYLVDAAFNNFQVFDQSGKLLLFVGSLGGEPGRFWIPTGIFIDPSDRIYVVDSANDRIQVFQYLGKGDDAGNG